MEAKSCMLIVDDNEKLCDNQVVKRKHGGKIEWESEVKKSSRFTLHFPIPTKVDTTKEIPGPDQELKSKELRIMVVDNEKAMCNMLEKFFLSRGHMVKTVNNGLEAIILTKIDDYDLVLCDLAMPEVSGYDVMKALNKLKKRPKIGILTGWIVQIENLEEEGFKVDFILKKPFNLSVLSRRMNNLGIKGFEDRLAYKIDC